MQYTQLSRRSAGVKSSDIDWEKQYIFYSLLVKKYDPEQLEEIVSTMADVMRTTEPKLRVNKSCIDTYTVQERYEQLDFTHIEDGTVPGGDTGSSI